MGLLDIRDPLRPWWAVVCTNSAENAMGEPIDATFYWLRTGGTKLSEVGWNPSSGQSLQEFALWVHQGEREHLDRTEPRSVPPPMCGQVWVSQWGAVMVVGTLMGLSRQSMVEAGEPVLPFPHHVFGDDLWPPKGACLQAGYAHPWAPTDLGWMPWAQDCR